MDKLLTQKEKGQSPDQKKEQEAVSVTPATNNNSSMSSGLKASECHSAEGGAQKNPQNDPSKNSPVELSEKSWDDAAKDEKSTVPWMNDPKGRLAVRTFSRGIMGAAFFVAGGMLAKKWMKGYDVTKSFMEQSQKNPITFIAKGVDTLVGKPIEAAVKLATGDAAAAKQAVLFRPTFHPGTSSVGGQRIWGRSLGAETVDVTFDFFCASIGDAFGRDLVNNFDPNVKKDWIDEKGHLDFGKWGKNALKATFRYVTYNGGEDWAVAIPYVYFMKGQRGLIDKVSPGFKYDSDQAKLGNSFKLGGHPLKDGKADYHHQSVITGNYALEGMLDLQTRFTVYNIGTLMYRELYNHIKDKLHGKNDSLYGAPDKPGDPQMGLGGKALEGVKWVARSAIKGVIVMTPSVPFFWITRSTQRKHRGLFIHPEHGVLTSHPTAGDPTGVYDIPVEGITPRQHPELRNRDVFYSRYNPGVIGPNSLPYEQTGPMSASTANPGAWPSKGAPIPAGSTGQTFHPYMEGTNILEKAFDKVGAAQNCVSRKIIPYGDYLDQHGGKLGDGIKKVLDMPGGSFRGFISPMVRASMSYTPYMYAKGEAASLWDNGKTDVATERFIDGAFSLNLGEVKAGMHEIGQAILHRPFDDVDREIEAQRRIQVDRSAPGVMTESQFVTEKEIGAKQSKRDEEKILKIKQAEVERKRQQQPEQKPQQPLLSWQERTIQARPEDRPEVGANRPKSHSEQEAMRKALEEMHPPTNAIN